MLTILNQLVAEKANEPRDKILVEIAEWRFQVRPALGSQIRYRAAADANRVPLTVQAILLTMLTSPLRGGVRKRFAA